MSHPRSTTGLRRCPSANVSIPKSELTNYVGSLSPRKLTELSRGLRIALELP